MLNVTTMSARKLRPPRGRVAPLHDDAFQLGVQSLGFRVQGSEFRVLEFRGLGFGVWGLGFRV